jgi:NADH:ubiquinone oxidoreductase subunit 5 (subunit L)/multisubunit Na+/H+ antiporter MnhA subunit
LAKLNNLTLANLLEQARGAGTDGSDAALITMNWPSEHVTHAPENFWLYVVPATLVAFCTALSGILLASVFYWWKLLDPQDVRNQFSGLYRFLVNKWWFDELYDWIFVKPALVIARCVSAIDKKYLDGLIDGSAKCTRRISGLWDTIIDRGLVDGSINMFGGWIYSIGLWLRGLQTGRLRQYVMFIAVGTVAVFILASFLWSIAIAGS